MKSPVQALEDLWLQRARAFRKEVMPYLGYMGQSGFPLVISLLFISSALGYFKLIRDIPSNFPFTLVGVIAVVPLLCWAPLRTWLVKADIVFHLQLEARMGHYLYHSFRRSLIMTVILAGLVLLLYWPIYRQGDGEAAFWMLIVLAAVLRFANSWGAWQERRLAWPGMRRLMRLQRWTATAAAWAALLSREPWMAALFALLIGLLLVLLYRLPARHAFPWERLIEEEERSRKAIYLFFGLFIDVPVMPSKSAARSYLSWLLKRISYRHANTFVYLYAASLIRTELGGIVVRLSLLSALVVYWFAESAWLSGWGAAAVYTVFLFVLGVQIEGLRRVHSYTVWRHVYPLPDGLRTDSIVRVASRTLAIAALLIWLPAGVTLIAMHQMPLQSVVAPAAAIAYASFVNPGRMKRKFEDGIDED
ncbi:ABC transporter permease [Paenibacillus sp. NEAU-GSW1]|uniref:ABC transporter permease n=1 Tax=Paenibacillus sp. NEAU-GSW1 TaxID=2682486 RepID=UPI0012E2845B|nr:ABC transporter permease [Paenibacillus sp. NEAU-GSW1]MUT65876.1 hypothetical protein [Paenibacillus sp. NEAU-GSW1]